MAGAVGSLLVILKASRFLPKLSHPLAPHKTLQIDMEGLSTRFSTFIKLKKGYKIQKLKISECILCLYDSSIQP